MDAKFSDTQLTFLPQLLDTKNDDSMSVDINRTLCEFDFWIECRRHSHVGYFVKYLSTFHTG